MRTHVLLLAVSLAGTDPLHAQTDGTCIPAAERAGRAYGCFITAREELGPLPATPLYWHLDTFPAFAAAEAARDHWGTAVRSLGANWLYTIADSTWHPASGVRVARIGPLPRFAADSFAALYMEGEFQPGMQTQVHRHPGPEAWYTLAGSMCLESSEGRIEQRAGDPGVFVAGDLPMQLTGTGATTRRSVVLILQDATKSRSSMVHDWTPKDLCRRNHPPL
jgi:hypothetical protein